MQPNLLISTHYNPYLHPTQQVNPMKLTTTQIPQPMQISQPIASPIDTPTEILIYLTLSTNTIKSLTHLLTALKTLKKRSPPIAKNNPQICTGALPAPKPTQNPLFPLSKKDRSPQKTIASPNINTNTYLLSIADRASRNSDRSRLILPI